MPFPEHLETQDQEKNGDVLSEAVKSDSPVDFIDFLMKRADGYVINNPHFEKDLQELGMLARLEREGVIPGVEPLNPYNVGEEKHTQWWQEHPKEHEEFKRAEGQRRQVLMGLYCGMMLHSFYGDSVAYPSMQKEREEIRELLQGREKTRELSSQKAKES
jgi:hypothetical protein